MTADELTHVKLCSQCRWSSAYIGSPHDPVPCGRHPYLGKTAARALCGGDEWEPFIPRNGGAHHVPG